MEYWNNGMMGKWVYGLQFFAQHSIIPFTHYSIVPPFQHSSFFTLRPQRALR
jgi:hypothetical protein